MDISVRGMQIAYALVNPDRGGYSPAEVVKLLVRGIKQAHGVDVEPNAAIAAMSINMERDAYRPNEVRDLILEAVKKSVPTCPICSQPWQKGEIFSPR